MHEPARARGLGLVKTFAKEPEPASLAVLGAEIIARENGLLLPPFRRDPLRSFDGGDFVQHAPPAKLDRRTIRHAGNGFDRFRPLQEADGAQSFPCKGKVAAERSSA